MLTQYWPNIGQWKVCFSPKVSAARWRQKFHDFLRTNLDCDQRLLQEIAVNAILTKVEWDTMPKGLFDQANVQIVLLVAKTSSYSHVLDVFSLHKRAPRYTKYSIPNLILRTDIPKVTQISLSGNQKWHKICVRISPPPLLVSCRHHFTNIDTIITMNMTKQRSFKEPRTLPQPIEPYFNLQNTIWNICITITISITITITITITFSA